MAERACLKRLQKEFHAICKEPPPQIVARPSPNDILDWHFVLEGSKGSPFEGGYYYGKLRFPPDYPYKPPSISMTTPNGRFVPHKKICLSMSDFHPETWNPMWSVSSILTGLLSFMLDDHQTTGSMKTSDDEKRKLAKASLAYNCESKNCPNFRKLFPEYVEKYHQLQVQDLPRSTLQQHSQNSSNHRRTAIMVEQQPEPQGEVKQVVRNVGKTRQGKQLPFWLLLLLLSFFSLVISLPLLQL